MSALPASCARAVLLGHDVPSAAEEAFFRRLALPNGTFKTTRERRLRDVDAWLVEWLSPLPRELDLLDVAVSSGVTTAELLHVLRRHGAAVRAVATDLTLVGQLLSFGPRIDLLVDSRGSLLELRAGSFVKGRPHDLRSLRRLLGWLVLSASAGVLRGARAAGLGVSGEVRLLSAALRGEPGVTLEEANLFERQGRWIRRFHLVRAANILQAAYFDEAELREAAAILAGYLRPEGHLLLAHSDDEGGGGNRASLLRLERGRLTVAATFNGGSGIDEVVSGALG